jgi:hypothetical protein
MVNYQNGKIYKIVCNITGKVYIGSTTKKYLSQRLVEHIRQYRYYLNTGENYITSLQVLENNNYEIMLLEEYPCSSKDALHARERFYCQSIDCVNKYKNPGLCIELGPKEYQKMYYNSHLDTIKEKQKTYRENSNKDAVKEYNKQYFKPYYEMNKEVIREKARQINTCDCGNCYTITNKARHEKTNKHQDYLKSLETAEIP